MPGIQPLTFNDPYDYQATIGAAAKIVATERGSFDVRIMQIDLNQAQLRSGKISAPGIEYSGLRENRCGITFFATPDHPPVTFNGSEASSDHIAYYAPGCQAHARSYSECLFQNISISSADLAEASASLAGRDVTARAQSRLLRPPPHLLARIRRLAAAAVGLVATAPEVLTRPEAAKAIEQELLRAAVTCLAAGFASSERVHGHHRVPVMRRFERLLEENPGTPLYLPEMCAAIGVSDRALRKHCHEYIGMPPTQYLWLRRMHFARRALHMADAAQATVTAIATEFGFWELGRFAVEYRALFGESPSTTLRRPPALPEQVDTHVTKVPLGALSWS